MGGALDTSSAANNSTTLLLQEFSAWLNAFVRQSQADASVKPDTTAKPDSKPDLVNVTLTDSEALSKWLAKRGARVAPLPPSAEQHGMCEKIQKH